MTTTLHEVAAGLIEAWNAHDVERVTAFYAPDYEEEDVAQATPHRGKEGVRRLMLHYLRAFPDLKLELNDVIASGDRLAVVWTLHGTHRGTLMNIPASGRVVVVRGTSILTLQAGLIHRGRRLWDVAGLLRAIGLLPELYA